MSPAEPQSAPVEVSVVPGSPNAEEHLLGDPPPPPTLLDIIAQHHLMPDGYILEAHAALDAKLPASQQPNLLIEKYLLKKRYIGSDTLAQAYAYYWQLPYVAVGQQEIPKEVIEIIPRRVAEKYGVIAFAAEGKTISVAIARPALLRGDHQGIFADLAAAHGVAVQLTITSPEQLKEAMNWYKWQRPVGRVRLFDRHLDPTALARLDQGSAKKLRLVVYEQVPTIFGSTPIFRVATDQAKSRPFDRLIRQIEEKNGVSLALYQTSREDLDVTLNIYDLLLEQPADSHKTVADIIKAQGPNVLAIAAPPALGPAPPPPAPVSDVMKPSPGIFDFLRHLFHAEKPGVLPPPTIIKTASEAHSVPPPTVPPRPEAETPQATVAPAQAEVASAEPVTVAPPVSMERYVTGKDGQKILNVHFQLDHNKIQSVAKQKTNEAPVEEIATDLGQLLDHDIDAPESLEEIALEGQVPKIVAALISYALHLEASDIHLEAEDDDERIRFRVDGILQEIMRLPHEMHPAVVSRIKILSSLKIDETRLPQDGRFDVNFEKRQVDIRVSILPTAHGEKIVMRLLDKDKGVLTVTELGFMGRALTELQHAVAKPYGIVLATGPTGSGKSTTLYALLGGLSKPGVNVSTLEDPIEFEIPGINQSQVNPQIGYTFAEGLRSLMRQDPNIIMVGEIRDRETAENATQAALTGHLVLSTLHTNDAAGALPRLIDMGVEAFLITSSINAVIGQRLVRKVCQDCKTEAPLDPGILADIQRELAKIPASNEADRARIPAELIVYAGKGCASCNGGYHGRIGIYEVMPMSVGIETLANKNQPADQILATAQAEGMITMKQDGYLKALAGITTVEEVLREAQT